MISAVTLLNTIIEIISANLVDIATLLGVYLSFISLNLGLAESEQDREDSLHQNLVLNDLDFMHNYPDYDISGIDVCENEGILYKFRKFHDVRLSFQGVIVIDLQKSGEIPETPRLRYYCPGRGDTRDILDVQGKGDAAQSIRLTLNSVRNIDTRETLQDALGVISRIRPEHNLEGRTENGKFLPIEVEYYPAKYAFLESISHRIIGDPLERITRNALGHESVSVWVHSTRNHAEDFGILPKLELKRPLPHPLKHRTPNPDLEDGDSFQRVPKLYNGFRTVKKQMDELYQEFHDVKIFQSEIDGRECLLIKDEKYPETKPWQIHQCIPSPGDVDDPLELSFIGVKQERVKAYYHIKENEFFISEWDKESGRISEDTRTVHQAKLEHRKIPEDFGSSSYTKCIWVADSYESVARYAGTTISEL